MKKLFITALIGALTIGFAACSSTEEKKAEVTPPPAAPEPAPAANTRSAGLDSGVDSANEKLAKVAVVGLPAFDAKGAGASAKGSLATVKEVVAEMPEGYVLEITGHHNQHPEKDKRKDDGKGGLSRQRAKDVYNYFVKNGIPKEKMTYRGAGSAERDENLSREKNRRVTFKVVKAG
ncbi:OmpA family protein [Turneriella parva]|uniref:OmpA-family lipoprotein n=1 Tax=Turneriella parva (strain ATCC BAA-1111 / DSM 21527 / NCTC 11395 / H) TaxID=869212 RepID=I4B184_TURPD|nr:OmpA family protein [Turneriella parva]AFM11041.1 OmpA-family lipoprotein [Turneriella parva DSM 21527]